MQIREPFSIMSVVKGHMGLMMGFMLIVMLLLPKLVENMGKYFEYDSEYFMFSFCFHLCCFVDSLCLTWLMEIGKPILLFVLS